MARIESNTSFKDVRKSKTKATAMRKKALSGITLLGVTGMLTLSYLNDNIFIEHIAVCGFIISCIAIIKVMENN